MNKIALLASSKISSQSIMRCYDWATEISRQEVIVSSGFSSQLERDVLHFLLKGSCRIQMVLARAPYKKLPKEFEDYIKSGRMEIISVCNTPRQTKDSVYCKCGRCSCFCFVAQRKFIISHIRRTSYPKKTN